MMPLMDDLGKALRYTRGLRDYWREPLALDDPAATVRGWLAQRETVFLQVMRRAVFQHPASPYLALMRQAGIDEPTVVALVADHGIEGALQRLYDAGVYATLEEFKGDLPIRRGSLEIATKAGDFDNPLSANHLSGPTGGSRSRGTRLAIDLNDLPAALPARVLHFEGHGLLDRPYVMWRPAPPALAGLHINLLNVKLGLRLVRWFSQTRPGLGPTAGKSAYLSWATMAVSRLMGRPFPIPEYVPMDRADVIARWLAEQTARGVSLHVDTMPSSGARICLAARDLGLDISGHLIRTGSEPLTETKAALFRSAGLEICSFYGMLEVGTIGLSCGDPLAVDDMHLYTFRNAIIQRPRHAPALSEPVDAILLTYFSHSMPKVMLNVETGDYGVMAERRCGCPLDRAGLHQHLHTIRSYEKLTSAGMHFMGSALIEVLDEALPARFGGGPTDYQFVEAEADGETIIRLVIAPGVGPLDEAEVVQFTLDALRRRTRAGRLQTDIWRDANMLRIERAQPYITAAAKIQPLHVERKRAAEREAVP